MTLAQLRSLTRNLAFERSGDTGLVDEPELDEIINLAQRNLYIHIANLWPAVFAERSVEFTVTTTMIVAFATIVPSGQPIHKITGVSVGTTGNLRPIPPFNRPEDKIIYQERGISAPLFASRWWTEGTNLVLSPKTSASFTAEALLVRQPTDLVLTTDTPWANKLPEQHDKIAVLAASIVHMKDEKRDTPFQDLFSAFDDILTAHLGKPTEDEGAKR